MSKITIKEAKKQYGDVTVIEGLNLEIRDGELFTLLGPSGCGKTTLLRMIAGFNSIEGGDFYFNEERINDKEPSKRNIGMVFQNYAIFPHLTVEKNVAFGLKNRKLPKDEIQRETARFLEMMQIEQYADRLPENLSGGQQQRVALARALVIKPDVLLMDEPLSNLDAKLRMEMRQAIRRIQREVGITTVYVTHDQLVVRRLPYTIRSSVAILQQIPLYVEEAALSLGSSKLKAFFEITLPMMAPGVFAGAILSWVTLISELSTAILLYTGRTQTLTVAIYTQIIRGNYGIASAMATVLTVMTFISLLLFNRISKDGDITL